MILELLRNRRSVRNFTGEDISMEIIRNILEAGRLSPLRKKNLEEIMGRF